MKKRELLLSALLSAAVLTAAACSQNNASASQADTTVQEQTTVSAASQSSEKETAPAQETQSAVQETETQVPETTGETTLPLTEAETTSEESTADEGIPDAEEDTDTKDAFDFKPGVWWAKSEGNDDGYYYFNGDGSGSVLFQEYGIGVPFGYEMDGLSGVFHKGGVDVNDTVSVTVIDDETLMLEWDSGLSETLEYIGDSETFTFYSNEELCRMAKYYYAENNGGYFPSEALALIQEDGLIAVQLYDFVDDHTATAAWYYIDRFTGKGTDMLGNEVDLTAFADSLTDIDMPQPVNKLDALKNKVNELNCICGVKYLGYISPEITDPDIYSDYFDYYFENTGMGGEYGADFGDLKDHFVSSQSGMELYIIVPADDVTGVTVSELLFDNESGDISQGGILYSQDNPDIFLLKCNVSEIIPDIRITMTAADGTELKYSPSISGENGRVLTENDSGREICDLTDYDLLATADMAPVG